MKHTSFCKGFIKSAIEIKPQQFEALMLQAQSGNEAAAQLLEKLEIANSQLHATNQTINQSAEGINSAIKDVGTSVKDMGYQMGSGLGNQLVQRFNTGLNAAGGGLMGAGLGGGLGYWLGKGRDKNKDRSRAGAIIGGLGGAGLGTLLGAKMAADAYNFSPTNVVSHFEGFSPKAYTLKGEKFPTVGFGTHLSDDKRGLFQRLFNGSLNFDKVRAGTATVDKPAALKLLEDGLTTRSNRLAQALPSFGQYPQAVQSALLSGSYRGDFGPSASPSTFNLVKQDNWLEAAKQYLNNDEYRNAVALGKPGIRPRMEWGARVMDWMGRNVTNNPVLPKGYQPVK